MARKPAKMKNNVIKTPKARKLKTSKTQHLNMDNPLSKMSKEAGMTMGKNRIKKAKPIKPKMVEKPNKIPKQKEIKLGDIKKKTDKPAFGKVDDRKLLEEGNKLYSGVKVIVEGKEPRTLSLVTKKKLQAISETYKGANIDVKFEKGSVPAWEKSEVIGGKLFESLHAKENDQHHHYVKAINEAYREFQRMFHKSDILIESNIDQKVLMRKIFDKMVKIAEGRFERSKKTFNVVAHVIDKNGEKCVLSESITTYDSVTASRKIADRAMEEFGLQSVLESVFVDAVKYEGSVSYEPLKVKATIA